MTLKININDMKLTSKLSLPVFIAMLLRLAVVLHTINSSIRQIHHNIYKNERNAMEALFYSQILNLKEAALTNSFSLANNGAIVHSLKSGNREAAINALKKTSQQFKIYSRYKDAKIHLHDSQINSFVRLWELSRFGDSLSDFRNTLVSVKQDRKPIGAVEVGVAGMLMRGISPIVDNGEYLGSIEVMFSLDNLFASSPDSSMSVAIFVDQNSLRDSQSLPNKIYSEHYLLESAQNSFSKQLIEQLKQKNITKTGFTDSHLYISMPVQDHSLNTVGYVVIAKNLRLIQSSVAETKSALYFQLMIVGIVILFVFSILYFTLQRFLIKPLKSISNQIQESRESRDLGKRLSYSSNDEIGMISGSYNQLMVLVNLFLCNNHQSIIDISEAANIMSDATTSTSSGIKNQEIETIEVQQNLQVMLEQVDRIANNSQAASRIAEQATEHAKDGKQVTQTTIDVIKQLAEEIREAVRVVQQLQDESVSIEGFTSAINGIAEQTNLLSLNAAIEAARAGESGRGFAVVADEVRNLAIKTQESTNEIDAIINRLKNAINTAVQVMEVSNKQADTSLSMIDQTEQALNLISDSIAEISTTNSDIATITQQQVPLFQNLSANMTSNVNQFNAMLNSSLEDTSQASYHMGLSIKHMYDNINEFKIDEDPGLLLHAAKSSHFAWKTRIQAYLFGLAEIDPSDTCPHNESYFGRWLYGEAESFIGHFAEYSEIKTVNHVAHSSLSKLIDAERKQDEKEKEQATRDLMAASEKLFSLMDIVAAKIGVQRESNLLKARKSSQDKEDIELF
jgi:methyl-accepting chemotaxis protein